MMSNANKKFLLLLTVYPVENRLVTNKVPANLKEPPPHCHKTATESQLFFDRNPYRFIAVNKVTPFPW